MTQPGSSRTDSASREELAAFVRAGAALASPVQSAPGPRRRNAAGRGKGWSRSQQHQRASRPGSVSTATRRTSPLTSVLPLDDALLPTPRDLQRWLPLSLAGQRSSELSVVKSATVRRMARVMGEILVAAAFRRPLHLAPAPARCVGGGCQRHGLARSAEFVAQLVLLAPLRLPPLEWPPIAPDGGRTAAAAEGRCARCAAVNLSGIESDWSGQFPAERGYYRYRMPADKGCC